jgi:pfkB family carbohydrate kinase
MHCLRSPPPRYDSNNHPHVRRPRSDRSVVGKEGAVIGQLHRVIHSIEDEWGTKRLLVIGDVMLDKYIWGEVGRISPEAPVPVVRGMRQDEKPGGAANVAMNLARLGAQTTVVGITGEDENARLLTDRLRSNGITPCLIASEEFVAGVNKCCGWTLSARAQSRSRRSIVS